MYLQHRDHRIEHADQLDAERSAGRVQLGFELAIYRRGQHRTRISPDALQHAVQVQPGMYQGLAVVHHMRVLVPMMIDRGFAPAAAARLAVPTDLAAGSAGA